MPNVSQRAKREVPTSIVSADDAFYEKLCDRANAPIGSNLLINSFGYNDRGVMKTFKPYADNTDTVVIIDDEGKQTDLHIGGILTKENIPETGFSEAFPILFHIPWGNIFFGIIFVTVVVMCITYVEMGREKDRNIIAEIRMDTM